MSYAQEKEAAIEAVTRAARLCAAVRADMVGSAFIQKEDRSPVTIADFGSQALVCQWLGESLPGSVIVGEENAAELRKPENARQLDETARYVRRELTNATRHDICEWIDLGGQQPARRFWTLDPIDGTKGFLRNDQYAIALALIEDGEVKVGVLACPALPATIGDTSAEPGVLFVAVRGEGATMRPLKGGEIVPIRVATNENDRRFVESVEAAHGNQDLQAAIAHAVGINQPALRMDSQAKYGAIARGDAVLYLRLPSPKSPNYRENIWDHAAGVVVVEEAGGRVTDMYGETLDFTAGSKLHANQGVVASNGVVHEAAIEALSRHRMHQV